MPTTRNGIEFTELYEVSERINNDSTSEKVRVCQLDWNARDDFVAGMLGSSTSMGDGIQRQLPDQHPEYPGLYAQECELVRGLGVADDGGPEGSISFVQNEGNSDECVYKVRYTTRPYDVKSGAGGFVERYKRYMPESIVLPGMSFIYTVGSKPVIAQASIHQYLIELHYVLHEWPTVPESLITTLLNHVNLGTFDDGQASYANETVLFAGVDRKDVWTAFGKKNYTLDLNCIYRPMGWNKFWSQVALDFVAIRRSLGDARGIYEAGVLDNLLTSSG